MRTRAGARVAFSAGCLADHGEPGLSAAADLRPVHPAGPGPGFAVRSAAPLSAAAAPADRPSGRGLLSGSRRRRLLLSHESGRRGAAGLYGAWYCGRRSAVFLRLFPIAAAGVGILGRHAGLFGVFVVFSGSLDEKFLQKNGPSRKKSLLFCEKMLYNKKNWAHVCITRR